VVAIRLELLDAPRPRELRAEEELEQELVAEHGRLRRPAQTASKLLATPRGESIDLAARMAVLVPGLLHWGLGWEGILLTSLNGLLLVLLFVWRRTLVAPALAHAAVNALVLWL
jgi:hypothetical protein